LSSSQRQAIDRAWTASDGGTNQADEQQPTTNQATTTGPDEPRGESDGWASAIGPARATAACRALTGTGREQKSAVRARQRRAQRHLGASRREAGGAASPRGHLPARAGEKTAALPLPARPPPRPRRDRPFSAHVRARSRTAQRCAPFVPLWCGAGRLE